MTPLLFEVPGTLTLGVLAYLVLGILLAEVAGSMMFKEGKPYGRGAYLITVGAWFPLIILALRKVLRK